MRTMPKKPKTISSRAERLLAETVELTRQMRESEPVYKERARLRARRFRVLHDEHGLSYRDIAEPNDLHHAQVVKAIDRYAGNGR